VIRAYQPIHHPDQIRRDLPEQVACEVRLDLFHHPQEAFACLQRIEPARCLITFRTRPHGGCGERDQGEALWPLRLQLAQAGCGALDLEWDEPNLPAKIQTLARLGRRIILSQHLAGQQEPPLQHPHYQLLSPRDVLKWVDTGRDVKALIGQRATYLHWQQPFPLVRFSMGGDFWATRLLSLRYGAPFTFIRDDEQEGYAPGMISRQDLTSYDLPGPLSDSPLFAVLGRPIGHSRSPAFHQPRLRQHHPYALFLPLPTSTREEWQALAACFPELRGAAVTSPMKEQVLPGQGAVNTLLADARGWRGINTDGAAVALLLRPFHALTTVRVLGMGGMGKAAALACLEEGFQVQVSNRDPARLIGLDPRMEVIAWPERSREGAAIFIQATTLGMAPHADISPLEQLPANCRLILETIYHPEQTLLLQRARAAGIQTLDGSALFRAQAELQSDHFCQLLKQA
jgi:3-dehydroquinate dehydratase/shikimate dehydrogenase